MRKPATKGIGATPAGPLLLCPGSIVLYPYWNATGESFGRAVRGIRQALDRNMCKGKPGGDCGVSLAEEIHQRRPFSSIQHEALISVFVTWNLLSRSLQRFLRTRNLTLAQYNALRILRGAGDRGLPLMSIARRMIFRYPNITRLTDRLETDGWILRKRCTKDRRVVHAFVSPAGLRLLASLDGEVDRINCQLMRGAGESDLRSLISILEAVRLPLRLQAVSEADAADDPEPAHRLRNRRT